MLLSPVRVPLLVLFIKSSSSDVVTKDSLLVEFDSVVLGTVGADCGCFVVED